MKLAQHVMLTEPQVVILDKDFNMFRKRVYLLSCRDLLRRLYYHVCTERHAATTNGKLAQQRLKVSLDMASAGSNQD